MSAVTLADAAAIARDLRSTDDATADAATHALVVMDRAELHALVVKFTALFDIAEVDMDDMVARARAWEASRA